MKSIKFRPNVDMFRGICGLPAQNNAIFGSDRRRGRPAGQYLEFERIFLNMLSKPLPQPRLEEFRTLLTEGVCGI